MFGLMGVARMSGQPGGAWSPLRLFAASEQGVWYDPSDFSSMFQDSAGTTPVTAVEQPVGLILDKSGNGNHASQPTAAARPVASARVNLLTYTEDLSNASWGKASCTATSDVSDPLGGTSAFTITATSADGRLARNGSEVTTTSGVTYTISAYIRRRTGTGDVQFYSQSAADYFSPTLALTTEWQRFTWTFTSTSTLADIRLPHIYTSGDAIDIWHPQLEIGSTATRYQRVTTASDYDTVGFPHYLVFDGVDGSLSIPATILLSADQVTEWHGALRIPGGGDVAVLCDFGNSGGGTETMEPFSGDGNYYSAFMNNERPGFGALASGVAYVMSELKDTTSLSVRLNGAQMGSVAAVTSKLGTAPAICRTSGSVWTGRVYLIIILGRAATVGEITTTEAYVASKSGVTL